MDENINEQDHIGLVYHVAQELANNDDICIRAFGKDVSEYLGEGYIALQKAKKNFNPSLGFKFSTYASKVIRDRLVQFARRSTLIKVSFQDYADSGRVDEVPGWEIAEELNARLGELDPRTRDVLIMRFGLDGKDPLTLEEVGRKFDPPLTRERIRQIEKIGVEQLREVFNM